MLTIDTLTKQFGSHVAVDNISLHVKTGEVLCILGPNGAGKSTTLKMILGLCEPSAGRVLVNAIDVNQDTAQARRFLAYIPEEMALHESFTGFENLKYFHALTGDTPTSDDFLESCLTRSGLQAEAWHTRLGNYSKGMRQKVGIAIALAKNAKLLVLDEPTSGLDPKSAFDFATLIKDLAAQGTAVIMATHDIFRAKDMADHIVLFKDGRIMQAIEPETTTYQALEASYLQLFEVDA